MKLNLLNYIDKNKKNKNIPQLIDIKNQINNLTFNTLNEFSEQYGQFLLTDINLNIKNYQNQNKIKRIDTLIIIITIIFIISLLSFFTSEIIAQINIDGLTELYNRRSFDNDFQKLINKVERQVSQDDMKITLSGGISSSTNGENIYVKTDKLLYLAKSSGKNKIIYDNDQLE